MPLDIEIDGQTLQVREGSTVMDAAVQAGIYVPHFCYHQKLSIAANCRMCLVQVEKAPKPLPACATPVTQGMKVMTHSTQAVNAQKGVMEFLLINHPLDCPICDQGGECRLQDLAVGYGGSGSQYQEQKRVVSNKNLGPLISTDMTRCIHCTRCVRFGQEIAVVMELGMIGRGEHSEIISFVGKTVDSELSGNVIDLCPVGALTSKPFRYSARTWELTRKSSVSPHCGLGSNLTLQIKQNRVMRVLPQDNEAVNECWISDKDRFSYEGLNSSQRLARPMIRRAGVWTSVDWAEALDFVVSELKRINTTYGAQTLGALASPHQTVEELYLLQKFMRAIGSDHIDFRTRQVDFSADTTLCGTPWLGMPISEISTLDRALVVGSTLRKDHPLLAHRFRQATKRGLKISLVHAVDDDWLMPIAHKHVVAPSKMLNALAQILKAALEIKNVATPQNLVSALSAVVVSDSARVTAQSLSDGKKAAIFLGNFAQHHAQASLLTRLANSLADVLGCRYGFLGEAANSVGGYVAKARPLSGGYSAAAMIDQPLKAYILLGTEPEFDHRNPAKAINAMRQAELVVAMSAFQHEAINYAHVLLPIAPFTETAGTFINTEGRVQSFQGVVQPLGETRPAWKVLRVLGNLMGLDGFEFQSCEEVKAEAFAGESLQLNNQCSNLEDEWDHVLGLSPQAGSTVERIAEVPLYAADALVRRAPALQATSEAKPALASMNPKLAGELGLLAGDQVRVKQGLGEALVGFVLDPRLPEQCVRLPQALAHTTSLGSVDEAIGMERVPAELRANA
ncbi:MAG: NADH-quinone oxidoreductase subunit NuoG [Betaproteobacteria bacterium]